MDDRIKNVYRGITYRTAKVMAEVWKYRQTCNNQPDQNDIAKAKARIYGICAEELLTALKNNPENKCTENHELYADKDGPCSVCGKPVNENF